MENEVTRDHKRKIVIVDDHPATRDGLALRISLEPDLEVCGQAADEVDALQVIQSTQPDVAVIDVSLKTGNGIDLVKRLVARGDSPRILVWSMYDESIYARRALSAGALGYVNKENDTQTVVSAIRKVMDGQICLSEEMSNQLLRMVAKGGSAEEGSPIDLLSDRELEVFRLIGRGKTTQEIAKDLHLSTKTVETYRARIKEKLNVSASTQLIQQATQWVLENG